MCSLKWMLCAALAAGSVLSSEGLGLLPELLTGLLRTDALQVRAPLVRAGGARMSAQAAREAKVTLLGFRPALPPLDPGQVPVQRLVANAPALPRGLSDGSVALLDQGRSLLWSPEAGDAMTWGAFAATGHAPLRFVKQERRGSGVDDIVYEVLVSISAVGLGAVDATGAAVALPLSGAEGLADVTAAMAVDGGQLLVARGERGEWVLLGPEEPPRVLGAAGQRVASVCVTAGQRGLVYVTADGSVQRVATDPEFELGAPETLASSGSARAVAVDEQGEVYVATAEGVEVLDDQGEPIAHIALPAAPSGLGFGGPARRTLFITAGDSVWSVQTSAAGAAPRSAEQEKAMDMLVSAGGDRIHVGW